MGLGTLYNIECKNLYFCIQGPAFAPIGITGDVYLEGINSSMPLLKLDSVNVVSQSSITKLWQVDVQLSGGDGAMMYAIDFQLKIRQSSLAKM